MEKQKLVIASGNKHKIKEIAEMLPDFEVVGYKDLGYDFEIEENGETFYENALSKAKAVSKALNLPALADDSGICVDALGGAPGIYSARYAGDGDDEHNNQLLLDNLGKLTNPKERGAKYVCCIVFYKPNGEILTATGETSGYILPERVGTNGFGYDPIFYSYDLDKCMGLATAEEKNSISHRFRAINALKEKLR
ncbi:MAG: RdgB/HAM1 family non-canonical purine NTP pyrophosphatase [Clostridiales bacterium]|nr:RdgB/HAM1 family non-canonical purine NTP pyrophosphatase [Clostridiales bacterium]